MRPKEYYERFPIHEDERLVFSLIPPEFENQYLKFIKEPLEKIEIGEERVYCKSNIEFEPGTDQMEETWKSIQKARVIIANITGFNPNIMLELGVALVKKERVILIAEESQKGNTYKFSSLGGLIIVYYDLDNPVEFSYRLRDMVVGCLNLPKKTDQPDRVQSPRVSYKAESYSTRDDVGYNFTYRLPGKHSKNLPKKIPVEKDETWENTIEMYSQIADIDDENGLVHLECKYKKDAAETFDRDFPLKHFRNKDRLRVDQCILVKILEKPGEVRFLFEETEENFFKEDVDKDSIADLKDSPIFKPLK